MIETLAFWVQFAPLILTFFIKPVYKIATYLKGIHDKIEEIHNSHETHLEVLNEHEGRICEIEQRLKFHVAAVKISN